ncbi:glutamate--tRNA ligase [Rhodotorula toruloides]
MNASGNGFELKGLYIVDRACDASKPLQKVELILNPDDRESSVALKHQAAAAPAEDASKATMTLSKDKQAAMKAKKSVKSTPRLPELAQAEAVEVVLKSDDSRGYNSVKTKMYKVDSPHGHEAYETPTTTSTYEMRPINE